MKIIAIFLAAMVMAGVFAGCASNVPQDNNGSIEPSSSQNPSESKDTGTNNPEPQTNRSTEILNAVWAKYSQQEKFSCYGGTVEQSNENAPGPLDLKNVEELTARYLFPEDMLSFVEEGASLIHMMNSNLFTATVVKLSQNADMQRFHETWRDGIQGNQRMYAQPDRLAFLEVESQYLLMIYGSQELTDTFLTKLKEAFPQAKELYAGAIVS